jgi:hypothetical protein
MLALAAALLAVFMAAVCACYIPPAGGQTSTQPETAWKVKPVVTFPPETINIEQWMKQNKWESKRHNPRRFEVGNRYLRMVSQDDSIMIGTQNGFPIDPHVWPRLRFRFRVITIPTGSDNSKKSGDDSAFRVYVAFDRGKGLYGPPHTMVYMWTENVEPETLITSPYFTKKLRYLSIGKGVTDNDQQSGNSPEHGHQDTAGWVTIERELLKDYRRAFPDDTQEVPMIGGILLKCDSNNTHTSAESWLAILELLAPAR